MRSIRSGISLEASKREFQELSQTVSMLAEKSRVRVYNSLEPLTISLLYKGPHMYAAGCCHSIVQKVMVLKSHYSLVPSIPTQPYSAQPQSA